MKKLCPGCRQEVDVQGEGPDQVFTEHYPGVGQRGAWSDPVPCSFSGEPVPK